MLNDSTVALCLGNFLRQELHTTLEQYDERGTEYLPALLSETSVERLAHASEPVVLQTLITFYDAHTSAHAKRLVALAEATGRYLHLSNDELILLRLSALLHDIGKVGIPPSILEKPGPLDDNEWKIMRLHPQIGQYILDMAGGVFEQLVPTIIAHHEHWDGSGYPSELAGEEIPLKARILSVVDSYDAMISQRSYREPLTIKEAQTELQICAGTQYDPRVVTAFLAILDEQASQVCTCDACESLLFSSSLLSL